MAITLGSITFDEPHTEVKEKLEEVGGRNERSITLSGLILGEESVAAIHARLDAILDEASREDFSVALSIRAGRRMYVRRNEFRQEVRADALVGSFVIQLVAREPYEEAIAPIMETWNIEGSGDARVFVPGGNLETPPMFSFTPSVDVEQPAFSDGVRELAYTGIVEAGSTFVVEGMQRSVTINGVNMLGYTRGVFPRLAPAGTEITYTDQLATPAAIAVTVTHAGRWW